MNIHKRILMTSIGVLAFSGLMRAAAAPQAGHAVGQNPVDLPRSSGAEELPPGSIPVPGAPGAFWHKDVPHGYVLIHGDIQVRLDDYLAHLGGQEGVFAVNFWITQVVPFDFVTSGSGAVSAANQQDCVDAMEAIEARTGVTFRPANTLDPARIRFQSSSGNNSPVGLQGGSQIINLIDFNVQFIVVHEIYHSLGFWHQQSAPDRDAFITVNYDNIAQGQEHNFDIAFPASTYGDYDFDSFMHYSRNAFSANGMDTITVDPPFGTEWQNAIGQLDHFSYWDELVCRGIYRYATDYWWEAGAVLGTGNLLSPMGGSLSTLMTTRPSGSTIFIKEPGAHSAVGTFNNPITLRAPLGATLGS